MTGRDGEKAEIGVSSATERNDAVVSGEQNNEKTPQTRTSLARDNDNANLNDIVDASTIGNDDENDNDSIDSKNELTLSKARCIALVTTVTGASFLNVSVL
jgi:hypothetical protein